jgi:hypothetical protein
VFGHVIRQVRRLLTVEWLHREWSHLLASPDLFETSPAARRR